MRHPMRVVALACVLAFTPACASLPKFENPMAAAQSVDQQAYALLATYAAMLEEATDVVRDPVTSPSVRTALGRAERAATPAIETLQVAASAYLRAKADLAASSNPNTITTLTVAANRLNQAITAARGPVGELQALIRGH